MKRTVRILRVIMPIVAIVCVVVFPPWDGILAWLAPLPDTVQQQVDDAVGHGLDGIIVYVDQAGKAPAFYCAGWRDRANRVQADPKALFKIASLSKLYIATASAKLVNDRRLSLDDTLAEHLPELVGRIEYADQITLRMLLQHRSGIPNYTDHDEFDWSMPPSEVSGCLELALDKSADFKPDADYRYSNTNYLLISGILDRVLGYGHQRYISEEILAPLGLTHTYGSLSDVELDDVVSGYHHPYEVDFRDVEYVAPGGAMVATAQDVGVFLRALNDGSLLEDDEQAIYSSIYKYGHKGWLLGYQSIARYHEDIDAVVIQLANSTGGESELVALVAYNRIVRILRRQ
ncbi:MAG: beta-lactamase family protein [bacterium]|nr:beta-lactamase family protein [bacterium]